MEITNVEVAAIETALATKEALVQDLCELELALVGGGCGEVLFG